MWERIDAFRRKLDAGKFCLGPAVTLTDPTVVEALCDSVDFLWIDLEHSSTSLETVAAHLLAARAGGKPALVRAPSSDVAWIKRILDTGAEGLIVPQIRSSEEVRQVVSACRYPPNGTRGYGPRRATNYNRQSSADYIVQSDRSLFIAIQIETIEAFDDLDAILAIGGYDCVVIGPYDLSGSMGILGQLTHPRVVEAIGNIVKRARSAGLYVGMGMGADLEYAVRAASQGVQWLQCGSDYEFMLQATDRMYGRIRRRIAVSAAADAHQFAAPDREPLVKGEGDFTT